MAYHATPAGVDSEPAVQRREGVSPARKRGVEMATKWSRGSGDTGDPSW